MAQESPNRAPRGQNHCNTESKSMILPSRLFASDALPSPEDGSDCKLVQGLCRGLCRVLAGVFAGVFAEFLQSFGGAFAGNCRFSRDPCNTLQNRPCKTMQYHAVPCKTTLQYPASHIKASRFARFLLLPKCSYLLRAPRTSSCLDVPAPASSYPRIAPPASPTSYLLLPPPSSSLARADIKNSDEVERRKKYQHR